LARIIDALIFAIRQKKSVLKYLGFKRNSENNFQEKFGRTKKPLTFATPNKRVLKKAVSS
jgi:hypothetical protein